MVTKPSLKTAVFCLLLLALVAGYYYWVWGTVGNFVIALDHCQVLFCDFTKQYYPTGQTLFETATPTNGYFYSSFFAILMAGMAKLELETAVFLWGVVQFITVLLLFLLPSQLFRQRSSWLVVVYGGVLITAVPVLHNLKWGQVSILITVCILGTLYFYQNGRKLPAALLLAFAFSIKYYAGIFLIYFALKREWRFLVVFAVVVGLSWGVLPLLLLGLENNLHFYQVIAERIEHARTTWMLEDINAQYFPSVATRWFEAFSAVPPARAVLQWLGYAVVGVNLWVLVKVGRQKTADELPLAFVLLFLSLPFLVETSWPHYFVYLPFCQLLVWKTTNKQPFVQATLLISIFLGSIFCFNLFPKWTVYSTYGLLWWANALVLATVHIQCSGFYASHSDGADCKQPTIS